MNEKWQRWLPAVFLALVALSRWPGLFPANFSAAYALMFCAGALFTGRKAFWLPICTLLLTDIALNIYYAHRGWPVWGIEKLAYQGCVYVSYIAIFFLGRRFTPQSSSFALLGGGMLGALAFFVITNTASWLFNPFDNREYTMDFTGWLLALVKGTSNWPDAWLFFRNSLISSGLFTAIFVAAAKLSAPAESPAEKQAGVREKENSEEEGSAEEAKT